MVLKIHEPFCLWCLHRTFLFIWRLSYWKFKKCDLDFLFLMNKFINTCCSQTENKTTYYLVCEQTHCYTIHCLNKYLGLSCNPFIASIDLDDRNESFATLVGFIVEAVRCLFIQLHDVFFPLYAVFKPCCLPHCMYVQCELFMGKNPSRICQHMHNHW